MRIELLDPRWKSQRDAREARKAQASELQRGANVVSSLKNLARTRVDIFGTETDEERRKREEEEERERRKEREKVVWDGHTATKAGTLDKYSSNVNFDEQIAAIHRAKGLGPYVSLGPSSCVHTVSRFNQPVLIHFFNFVYIQARSKRDRPWDRSSGCTATHDSPLRSSNPTKT